MQSQPNEQSNDTFVKHLNKDEYILGLEARIESFERKASLATYVFPYNAFIVGDKIHFCYDPSQRKELGNNDKMIFDIRTISVDSFNKFLNKNISELNLKQWVCMEGGEGYYSNSIDMGLYNECFKSRLSECLFKMIESDNELKLSLLKSNVKQFYERNR